MTSRSADDDADYQVVDTAAWLVDGSWVGVWSPAFAADRGRASGLVSSLRSKRKLRLSAARCLRTLRQPDRRWPPGTFGFLTEPGFDQHSMGLHRFEGEPLRFSIWLD